jgi:hypothetical protein
MNKREKPGIKDWKSCGFLPGKFLLLTSRILAYESGAKERFYDECDQH